jgi:tetratricopeptide (TPR) repeat protein
MLSPVSPTGSLLSPELRVAASHIGTLPDSSYAYTAAATLLGTKDTLTIPDGRKLSKTELYIEAIRLDPGNARAYSVLATLVGGKFVTLHDGRELNAAELHAAALKLDPSLGYLNTKFYWIAALLTLGCLAATTPRWWPGLVPKPTTHTFDMAHATVDGCDGHVVATKPAEQPAAMPEILPVLQPEEHPAVEPEVKPEEQQQPENSSNLAQHDAPQPPPAPETDRCLTTAQRRTMARAYFYTAVHTKAGMSERMPDGRMLSQPMMYMEAIRLDRDFGDAYVNLAVVTLKQSPVFMADRGYHMSTADLYVEAIRVCPACGEAINNLGATLPKNGTIVVAGKEWTKEALYKRAIEVKPTVADPYLNLGDIVGPNATTTLLDGRVMSAKDLFRQALLMKPDFPEALMKLSEYLAPGERETLPNGRIMTKLDPESPASKQRGVSYLLA